MGTLTMLRVWVLSVVTLLNGASTQQTVSQRYILPTTRFIQPTTRIIGDSYQSLYGINVDHNLQVCSTWGNFHFSTFDGQFFQLPYTCNHILTTLCDSTKTDFNVQMRRQYINNLPTISSFTIKIQGAVVQLLGGNITMNQKIVDIPSNQNGISIERITSFIKISSKLGLTVFWDERNSLSIEISTKYRNQTCGLCGDFNGVKSNEFNEKGEQMTSQQYGLKWKMDAPKEICEETALNTKECQIEKTKCEKLLSDPAFSRCRRLLSTDAFVEACVRDMCQCNSSQAVCVCDTLSEFSRQCAHAGGKPKNWRTNNLCGKKCPFNLEHKECGSPCKDSCSNQEESQVCAKHCVEGCFCPSGLVFNDIEKKGCIPVDQCPCIHNGKIYQPGQSYNRTCQKCVCSKGQWSCKNLDCPGTCSLQGGSHITTYDGKAYTFHGNCHYVLSKDNNVTVLANLVQCGQTKTETCLTEVKFIIPTATVTFLSIGTVRVNDITNNLPIFVDQVTIFKPSTFYIIAHTASLQLVIQMVPVMQVYIVASSKKKGTLSGLCGNFNDVKADDFKTESGLKEGTAATFANTWKVMTTCPDVSNCHQDPCSMSVEKERYAKEWCSLLTDPKGVFSPCHVEVNPVPYKDRCIYDACKCARSEECMCAAVSSYAHTCAAEGVLLQGWRNTTCDCSGNMKYYYHLSSCETTCRSLSGYDYTCKVSHTPVDGCACAKGTYLDDKGKCVPASSCPCYHNNQVVAPSQVINKDGTTCTCTHGKLECLGELKIDCPAPMYYFNCSKAGPGAKGVECQKSCHTLDADQCMSTQCTSGCVCPNGQLADGRGGCVKEENCPCFHNGVFYQPGQTVKEDCNTCTCRNRKFLCTSKKCPSTCTIYGEGHYMTFDSMRYSFSGDCEYVLAQDYCGNSLSGSFRIITENIPCGTTGTTCSRSVKLFLGNKEFILSEEKIKVFSTNNGTEIAHKIYTVGIYFVIEASNGLVLHWDKKTSLKITLDPLFKRKVCGLCGNYDGNGKNDFVTRGGEEVVEPLEFGNSWRVSSACPKASIISSPCNMRPHRQAWAIKQCSIIKSDVFKSCHSLVDPDQYYDICVQDTCACDTGGDCECYCTAVAAYAAACNEKGACISWRTPTICPLFCDYYNVPGGCEWHYKPCGQCVKTCSNPSGDCFNQTLVEGCFPKCPTDRPYLNEETMNKDNNTNYNRPYHKKFNNTCLSVHSNNQTYNSWLNNIKTSINHSINHIKDNNTNYNRPYHKNKDNNTNYNGPYRKKFNTFFSVHKNNQNYNSWLNNIKNSIHYSKDNNTNYNRPYHKKFNTFLSVHNNNQNYNSWLNNIKNSINHSKDNNTNYNRPYHKKFNNTCLSVHSNNQTYNSWLNNIKTSINHSINHIKDNNTNYNRPYHKKFNNTCLRNNQNYNSWLNNIKNSIHYSKDNNTNYNRPYHKKFNNTCLSVHKNNQTYNSWLNNIKTSINHSINHIKDNNTNYNGPYHKKFNNNNNYNSNNTCLFALDLSMLNIKTSINHSKDNNTNYNGPYHKKFNTFFSVHKNNQNYNSWLNNIKNSIHYSKDNNTNYNKPYHKNKDNNTNYNGPYHKKFNTFFSVHKNNQNYNSWLNNIKNSINHSKDNNTNYNGPYHKKFNTFFSVHKNNQNYNSWLNNIKNSINHIKDNNTNYNGPYHKKFNNNNNYNSNNTCLFALDLSMV
ncbi:LOW QUALITY PROTEIN: mucin-5AC-like [Colossoma macropomum]|uniref:LOW QUALITY PROTEIN: mucin-5AC-like n=1 Tax=Colossoma macropomum TaxID=42526 RepID=UPI00186462B3|nr:LOW QUALITY PROTEIN: mucin-5AC-like [Colossoma macropomum]